MLTSGGKRVSWDIAADATTNNNPPITSTFGFYVTLTAELADDISLRHIILFFNFIKFTNPNTNPNPDPNPKLELQAHVRKYQANRQVVAAGLTLTLAPSPWPLAPRP